MVESGGGSGVSDSLEVNLGIVGETSVDAPLSHHLFFALYFMNVTRYTRAGREGKCIECPECQNQAVVWHFAWSALTCSECETSYPKYEWKIAACELAS